MTAASHPLTFWVVVALSVLFVAFFALGFVTIAQAVFVLAQRGGFSTGRDLKWSERWGRRNSVGNQLLIAPEFAKHRRRLALAGAGAQISFVFAFAIVVVGQTPS